MSSEATLHDAAIILSKLANCSQLFSLPSVFPTIQSPPSTSKNGNVIAEDLAIIEASTSRMNPNHMTSSSTSKKNSSKRRKNSSKSPREFRGRSRGRSQSRSRTRSNSVGANANHIVQQHQLSHPNQQNLMMNRQVNNSQQQQQQTSGRRSSSSNGGKHIKFVLNNIPQNNMQKQQSIIPHVPRVYTNSGFSRNNANHHQQAQNQTRPQRDRSNSESMAYNNQNINPLRSNQQRNQPRLVQQKHLQPMKPGMSNDFVSREIIDYYQRNRQTNEKYKAKQILRQSLENTLKQSFPTYFINLHIIGSTTNGIGDNVSAVDICVLSRKKPIMTRVPPSSPVSTNGDSTTANDTPNEEDEPITSIKNLVENDFKKEEDKIVVAPADSNTIAKDNNGTATAAVTNSMEQKDDELTLKSIEKILQTKNFAQNIILIPARVPVIKFKDIICNLDVTLNLNQEMSIRNTQLIRDYSKMDWRFPPLATIIKQWARENRINCAVEKSISPYSWTLMVIHYLQVCDPPVLPCLQRMHSKRYDINVSIEEEMNAWRQSPGKWFSKNNSTLKQLLKGLFRYYGYNFDYDKYVISVREGKVLERFKLQSSINSKRATNNGAGTNGGSSENNSATDNAIQWNSLMCVEEPFTRNNTTRSVHDPETFDRIRELLRMSSNALKGNRISLYNIIIDDLDFPVKY